MTWYSNDILVNPDQLWDFAWSAPMRDLAAQVGLSDVGLKKLLRTQGIAPPPQGYWNKLRAGKPVPVRPRLSPRGPGESGRIRVDARFGEILSPTPPMSANGPFASAAVPEDLEALRAQELKAIGRAGVPAALDRFHPALQSILKQEARRSEKAANLPYHWDAPKFDNPVARRSLRILNAIFLALARRGHSGAVEDRNGEISARAFIGGTSVGLDLGIAGKHRTVVRAGYHRPDPALPASTPLILRIDSSFRGTAVETWQDDGEGTLETRIGAIAASIIVAGEAAFRRHLKEEVERQELARVATEKARLERLAALNRQRFEDLHKSGELLRQAEDIRALVAQVKAAALAGSAGVDSTTAEAWERWALAEADRIDPVKSGQIETHLMEPTLS